MAIVPVVKLPRLFLMLALSLALSSCGDRPAAAPLPSATGSNSKTPPARFVGVTESGDVVIAATASGKIERVLVPHPVTKGKAFSLSLTPDLQTLYFANGRDERNPRVMRVPVAGGVPVDVACGGSPAISPDSKHLAWAEGEGDCGGGKGRLHVRDLQTGSVRTWTDTTDIGNFSGVLFFADNNLLWVLECGADSCGPSRFDIRSMSAVAPPKDWIHFPEVDGYQVYIGSVVPRGQNLVGTADYADVPENPRHPLLELDSRTGGIVRELMREASGYPMDFDRSGEFLLLSGDDGLSYWSNSRVKPIGRAFKRAIWFN